MKSDAYQQRVVLNGSLCRLRGAPRGVSADGLSEVLSMIAILAHPRNDRHAPVPRAKKGD